MLNSHDQKVPCEGGGGAHKTTDEAENEYIQIWKRERERERHGNVHHTVRKRLLPAGPWPQQCRLWDVPHGHSFAQGPGAVGWHAPSRWCAQGEEHGVDFQEPRHPLGGEPHAACRHKGWPSQEVHGSSQVTQVPGHLQAGPQATLPWRHLRLIRCATSECLMPDWSGCHSRLTQQSCMPCIKSELDLDSMLPLQIGMVNVYLVQTSPKLGPDGGGPLEFQIISSGDDYQDLSHCYHYLKCQVLKANGLPIKSAKFTGWEATFGPMNLLFHSLFRQVDLVMNNILVATSGDTYLYGAYLTMLAGYGCQAKKTLLKHPEGWAPARQKFTMCGKTEAWSSIWRWSRTVKPSTSRAACTQTCCCRSDWCPTIWTWFWCSHGFGWYSIS